MVLQDLPCFSRGRIPQPDGIVQPATGQQPPIWTPRHPTHEGAVTAHVPNGETFVPRLFKDLGIGIRSVSVARPSLDDVFMAFTGRTIRDAESSSADRLRQMPWMRMRGR